MTSDTNAMLRSFREQAVKRLELLVTLGFRREPDLETTTATVATVIYMGRHVGFVVSYDARDEAVDVQITAVGEGGIRRTWEGGYSSNLLLHLTKHCGYRGTRLSSIDSLPKGRNTAIERSLDAWAEIIRSTEDLLRDRPESLPSRK